MTTEERKGPSFTIEDAILKLKQKSIPAERDKISLNANEIRDDSLKDCFLNSLRDHRNDEILVKLCTISESLIKLNERIEKVCFCID